MKENIPNRGITLLPDEPGSGLEFDELRYSIHLAQMAELSITDQVGCAKRMNRPDELFDEFSILGIRVIT